MLDKIKKIVSNNKWVQFALVLLLGVVIGAVFYPTQHIEERLKQTYAEQISRLNETHKVEIDFLKESIERKEEVYKTVISQKEEKLSQLSIQVTELKKSQKTTYYKLIKPDGTVEVRKTSDMESEESSKIVTQIQQEFKEKVESIENKWATLHKQRVQEVKTEFYEKEKTYQTKIAELEKEKITDINPKKYGIEAGLTLNNSVYVHSSADFWGPFFIGVHSSVGTINTLGGGLGVRF